MGACPTPKPLFLILSLGSDLCNNGTNKNETFGGEMIESASKLKMSYAPEEHLYVGGLEFEMHFPTEKKSLKWWLGSKTNQQKSMQTIISLWATPLCNTELE